MLKRSLGLLGVASIIVVLTGCTSSTPSPVKTTPPVAASTSPQPTVKAKLANIVIKGNNVVFEDARGDTIDSYSYKDSPKKVVEALTKDLGKPSLKTSTADKTEGACSATGSQLSWNGFHVNYEGKTVDESTKYTVSVDGNVKGIKVESVKNISLGDSIDDVVNLFPNAATSVYVDGAAGKELKWVALDLNKDQSMIAKGTQSQDANGAIAFFVNSKLTQIYSPGTILSHC